VFVFFFQAEDGIRDFHVTGVQTCALPISPSVLLSVPVVSVQPLVQVPIRLCVLLPPAVTTPSMSLAVVDGLPPLKFSATIELRRITALPPKMARPPPSPTVLVSESERLFVIVLLVMVTDALPPVPSLTTPPPLN